jgi:integrase
MEKGKTKARCRRWQLRVSVGKQGGKYRQRTRVVRGTYTDACRELPRFIAELEDSAIIPREGMPTVEQCCREWLSIREGDGLSSHTMDAIRVSSRTVCRLVGGLPVQDVSQDVANSVVRRLVAGETARGRPLKPSSVALVVRVMSHMWDAHAVPMGYAASNPWRGVKKPRQTRKPRQSLSERDYGAIVAWAVSEPDRWRIGVLLGLCAGLRVSECVSVRWSDWDGALLHVPGTKNEASDATVPVSRTLADALDSWKDRCVAFRMEHGMAWDDSLTVTCDLLTGEPANPRTMSSVWARERASLGLGWVRFHDLRHGFVTRCIRLGLPPKVTQQLARHSSFAITMDLYAHLTTDDLVEGVSIL